MFLALSSCNQKVDSFKEGNVKVKLSKKSNNVVQEQTLTDEQYQQLFALYTNEDFKRLRKIFDLSKQNDNQSLLNFVEDFELSQVALNSINKYKSYYKSKFIILGGTGEIGGGMNYQIVFVNSPKELFEVWVYTSGEIRQFRKLNLNDEEQNNVPIIYRKLLKDRIHCL